MREGRGAGGVHGSKREERAGWGGGWLAGRSSDSREEGGGAPGSCERERRGLWVLAWDSRTERERRGNREGVINLTALRSVLQQNQMANTTPSKHRVKESM